jgi:hypothetical protein
MYLNTKQCSTGLDRPSCISTHTKVQLENADLLSAFVRQQSERGNNFAWGAVEMWREFCSWANVRRSELQDIVLDAFVKQIQGKSFKHIVYKRRADGSGIFSGIRKRRGNVLAEMEYSPENSSSDEENDAESSS